MSERSPARGAAGHEPLRAVSQPWEVKMTYEEYTYYQRLFESKMITKRTWKKVRHRYKANAIPSVEPGDEVWDELITGSSEIGKV